MKRLINYIVIFLSLLMIFSSCHHQVENVSRIQKLPNIYPDYVGVTIPADIAPLNFNFIGGDMDCMDVIVRGSKSGELHVQGEWACFDIDDWKQLTKQNKGGELVFSVCVEKDGRWFQYNDFKVYVSSYPLSDYGLTYRRIPPGYEVGSPGIGIYQRDLHSFDESPILKVSAVYGHCINCHTANRTDPSQFTMQFRGEGGGTLVQKEGKQQWLNTRTDSTKAAGSYAYWHPSGNYCAYTVNSVHQNFHLGTEKRIEAYHKFSDLILLDTRTNQLLLSPLLMTEDQEIFPAFSPDGKYLYYSSSKPCNLPLEYEKVKCSVCKIAFDAKSGTFGDRVDTLINAEITKKSCTLVRPSYDGRWLMYCMSDHSNFPVFQNDADLWLMDLKTGKTREMKEVNSSQTESYHNWSSDSHWFVFSSKRENGEYAQLYLASIDDLGHLTKPFLLPQRNPVKYYGEMFDSYNVPDFTKTPVKLNAHEVHQQVFEGKRIQVEIKD
jgi:hypothetical protein